MLDTRYLSQKSQEIITKKILPYFSMKYEYINRMLSTIDIIYWSDPEFVLMAQRYLQKTYGERAPLYYDDFFDIILEMSSIRDIYFKYKNKHTDIVSFYNEVDASKDFTISVINHYIEQGSIIDTVRLLGQAPGRVYCGLRALGDMFVTNVYNEETKTWDTTHAEVMDKLLKQFAEKQIALTDLIGMDLCYQYYTKYDN